MKRLLAFFVLVSIMTTVVFAGFASEKTYRFATLEEADAFLESFKAEIRRQSANETQKYLRAVATRGANRLDAYSDSFPALTGGTTSTKRLAEAMDQEMLLVQL